MLGRQITERLCLLFRGQPITRKLGPFGKGWVFQSRLQFLQLCTESVWKKREPRLTPLTSPPHHTLHSMPHPRTRPHTSSPTTAPHAPQSPPHWEKAACMSTGAGAGKSELCSTPVSCGVAERERVEARTVAVTAGALQRGGPKISTCKTRKEGAKRKTK